MRPGGRRDVGLGLIVSGISTSGSKSSTAHALRRRTAGSSFGWELGLEQAAYREPYATLGRPPGGSGSKSDRPRHRLEEGTLLLCDIAGGHYTDPRSEPMRFGCSRDRKPDCPQKRKGHCLCSSAAGPPRGHRFPHAAGGPGDLDQEPSVRAGSRAGAVLRPWPTDSSTTAGF